MQIEYLVKIQCLDVHTREGGREGGRGIVTERLSVRMRLGKRQLLTVDLLAHVSMKNAASCDK